MDDAKFLVILESAGVLICGETSLILSFGRLVEGYQSVCTFSLNPPKELLTDLLNFDPKLDSEIKRNVQDELPN